MATTPNPAKPVGTAPRPTALILPAAAPTIFSRPFFEQKNRAFWLLQAAGWSGYLLLRSVSSLSNGLSLAAIVPILIESIIGYCITLLMSALYGYFRKFPRISGSLLSVLTLAAATALYAVLDAFSFSFVSRDNTGISLTLILGTIFLNFTVLAGWSALYFGINFYLIIEDQIDQLEKLGMQATTAQLAMLRYQLNPHFLFNTLNSISTLVLLKQTERANAMLSRLSSFLRYTLANEPTAHVTIAQEIETLKLYLEIEKMRFEARLRPTFSVDPRVAKARLPSLLLQPLVENAIKYAVTPCEDGAEIHVSAQLNGAQVQITVSDTGPGLRQPKSRASLSTGVGIANTKERLAQAYGPGHRFETRSNPGGGFRVEIDIPFQLDEPARETA